MRRLHAALRTVSREELANATTHGLGVLLVLAGLPALAVQSIGRNDGAYTAAVIVYGISLLCVFASSTLHHVATHVRLKSFALRLDHASIYLLIAGTYTPFAVTTLRGSLGAALLCAVWALALLGILWKTLYRVPATWRHELASVGLYLAMGWIVLFVLEPFVARMAVPGIVLLLVGGLCFSFGVLFFLVGHLAYAHAVWHVFVLAGSVLHYFSVLLYAVPA